MWDPAQRRPAPALEGAARLRRRSQAEAERLWEGRGPSLSGEARVGPGAHSGGVQPRFSLRGRRRARRQGCRRAEAERRRGGRGPFLLIGEARIGPGIHSVWVLPRFSLRGGRLAMGYERRQAEAEQSKGWQLMGSYPHRAKPGSGRAETPLEWSPASVQAAWASPGRSRATQGRVRPLQSTGRAGKPLRWGPAQIQPAWPKAHKAARALQGRSRATQGRAQPLPAWRSPGRAGSPLGWGPTQVQPRRQKARNAVWASPGLSREMQGRAQPLSIRTKPGSRREPNQVGSGPGSAFAVEGAPDCMGVAEPMPSDSGEDTASSPPGEGRFGPGAHSGGSCPDSACMVEGVPDCIGVAGPKPRDAGKGAASPRRAKPG